MADELKNTNLISKKNTGFPGYLDFEKLRTEGIDYLGRLGGKIWTDHNVHDPGITILEMLCYALLDLGYRTNLPVEDLLTRNAEDQSADNNFFTPAQILACNPLTIIDFRKLLIDIEGVKNAWLEAATDEHDFCRPRQTDPAGNHNDDCTDFLNGLYHVCIDLEKNVEKEYKNHPDEKNSYLKGIENEIKNALMTHRNLCEDFIDIYFLCKQETGVCADIELEENADAEDIYITVVEKLQQFFSPSPQFYTLQQLLDRQKPIDEIFAGRPYNITQSHGFVDTEELEQLKLRKEIHLSDVYAVLLETEGVRSVRNLTLQLCKNSQAVPVSAWKLSLPKNHVPEFSIQCSGFQFTKHGRPVFIDFKKFEGLFEIDFTHNGKILNQLPSPYLDGEIPGAVYHKDLADYYSIQNEFPRVYGIAEGGLSDNASPLRKAQAYQLKAYLLFFDQLLANYLAQLKNIRNLFAMSANGKEENHTYFINQLTTVPDHQKLVRFNVTDNNNNTLGTEGSILVFPVDKEMLLNLKKQDKLKALDIENLQPRTFSTLAEQDTVISQVKNDLLYEQYQCELVTKTNDCIYYYILPCTDEIALISKKYFKNKQAAEENAASVKYIAGFDENYRSFITSGNNFSFDIELNLLSFTKYLQLIVEDKEMFYLRRQGFLNHLLARFAEQFTDFAMLSFGFYHNQQLQIAEIKNKESFLTNYNDLSSNRGKAYDYLKNGWNNDNVSGFEKKFKAISGIENWKRHSLCNFEVARYEEQFEVVLKIAGTRYFTAEDKFDSKDEALAAAQKMFKALKNESNYQAVYVAQENAYDLKITYAATHEAVFPVRHASAEEALGVANSLSGLFREKDPGKSVFVSGYIYTPYLEDWEGNRIRRSVEAYASDGEAKANALKTVKKINDPKKWEKLQSEANPGTLYYDSKNTGVLSFIDTDAFKIDIDNTIIGKPDKFTYNVLDKGNSFKFNAVKEFDDALQARAHAQELLALLAGEKNYEVFKDEKSDTFLVRIAGDDHIQATSSYASKTEKEAQQFQQKIFDTVKKHQYFISVDQVSHRWKFKYQLGYEKSNLHSFESINEYPKPDEAFAAAALFYKAVPALRMLERESEILLSPQEGNGGISAVKLMTGNTATEKEAVKNLLAEQKEIAGLSENPEPEAFSNSVAVDEISRQGLFVYRLVNKDCPAAFFTKSFSDKNNAKDEAQKLAGDFKTIPFYLRLCMGGDIFNKRKDEGTNTYWYHYQLKSLNSLYQSGSQMGKPLILFESTKGYQSVEEAEKAFKEIYLMLIYLASGEKNYGTGKKISLTEILVHATDPCIKNDSIVFVPNETLEYLGAGTDAAIKEIIKLALSFPIRQVQFKSKAFYDLFTCEEEEKPGFDDCKKEKDLWVYYFTLPSPPPETVNWQSVKFYDSAEEARRDFDFFIILLGYAGNYFVDCDQCADEDANAYHVYLREVLAESAERFVTEQQAWGSEGVQKFICVSETENAFHTYSPKEDCCYSFYVACSTGLVYHPCKYDTAQKRDDALLKLYQSLKEVIQKDAWQAHDNDNNIVLTNGDGTSFAAVNIDRQNNNCISDRVAAVMEHGSVDNNYTQEEGKIILRNNQNEIIASSLQENITLAAWKEMLLMFVCRYPIEKNTNELTGQDQYCIQIKLPGFNTCGDNMTEEKPCGCENEPTEDESACYIAWKGRCCYATCAEAEQALQGIIRLLDNFIYYQPVFDCECAGYGIALQFTKPDAIPDENVTYYWNEANIVHWSNSEIVAVNPQCYSSPEMACDAVGRAKKLINSEGLHFVEHILLRPRCNPEDCQCSQYTKRCDDKTGCGEFQWRDSDEDPCTVNKSICFVPGADRYSFIATVVLPGWPARFRKKENRQLLENIFYREAPAHILLRILWLAPHDFCCFEKKYKNWNRWLALKNTCIDDFSVCDLLEFLFNRNYECLPDCEVCKPCEDNTQQRQPCFGDVIDTQNENEYLNQVNDLYCWQEMDCANYRFIDCESQQQPPEGEDDPILLLRKRKEATGTGETKKTAGTASNEKTIDKKKAGAASRAVKRIESEHEVTPAKEPDTAPSKPKRQVVNSRMAAYRTMATDVFKKSKHNPLAAQVQSFLSDPAPSPGRLLKLATEVVDNKALLSGRQGSKGKDEKAMPGTLSIQTLTKKQVYGLLQSAICYYLDSVCFNGKDIKKITDLEKVFTKLRKEKINLVGIYAYWDMEEIKKHEPALDETEIRRLFGIAVK